MIATLHTTACHASAPSEFHFGLERILDGVAKLIAGQQAAGLTPAGLPGTDEPPPNKSALEVGPGASVEELALGPTKS